MLQSFFHGRHFELSVQEELQPTMAQFHPESQSGPSQSAGPLNSRLMKLQLL